ncbi:MAG: ATP-binding cassette domain-containing protein [Chitinophagaceae bacterium]|nr:ATP-binding cassette domain-containing protein [Chitinophagaceae bacterium]MCW5904360.1 ATP-binding cassette domain-containing protein [Chitinophagaceae bacterium]
MQITLNNIVPTPLKDTLLKRKSDVWNTTQNFSSNDWIKIKAPSGTGKTTLIHILYKLRFDFDGSLLWNNISTNQINETALATIRQEKLSIIFQDLKLFPNLTARENIELKRVLPKPYYDASAIDLMAEKLGVTHILHQRTGLCSYGEQQRIAIIRALIQPFELLLMDEPFSHLDKENTSIAATLIAEECIRRNAGFVLTDLDDDNHFNYSKQLSL